MQVFVSSLKVVSAGQATQLLVIGSYLGMFGGHRPMKLVLMHFVMSVGSITCDGSQASHFLVVELNLGVLPVQLIATQVIRVVSRYVLLGHV